MVQLNEAELAALRRFDECAQDGEGHDVPKEMMQRLAEIGVVRRQFGANYITTEFGMSALLAGEATLPYTEDDLLELVGIALDMREVKHWKMQAGSKLLAEIIGRLTASLATARSSQAMP